MVIKNDQSPSWHDIEKNFNEIFRAEKLFNVFFKFENIIEVNNVVRIKNYEFGE